MRSVTPVEALIDAFFAASTVLDAQDVTQRGITGGSSNTDGRRYLIAVTLLHVPTNTEATVRSEQPGGRTRAEAKQARADVYLEALQMLERKVQEAVRAQRRRQR